MYILKIDHVGLHSILVVPLHICYTGFIPIDRMRDHAMTPTRELDWEPLFDHFGELCHRSC